MFGLKRMAIAYVVIAVFLFWIVIYMYNRVQARLKKTKKVFCGVDGSVDSDNSGFSGSGFANTDNVSMKGADTVTFACRTNGGHNFSNLAASLDNEPQSEGKLNITLMFNHC